LYTTKIKKRATGQGEIHKFHEKIRGLVGMVAISRRGENS